MTKAENRDLIAKDPNFNLEKVTPGLMEKLTRISDLEKEHSIIGVGFSVEPGKENLKTRDVADQVIRVLDEAGAAFRDETVRWIRDASNPSK